ncbi:MAG: type I restriction endonuclease subunit R, partial [Alphaproteobacteria bacterium]|nr:type I restriction endonuclease subunit R [Alphaproteobacteria bacterium]
GKSLLMAFYVGQLVRLPSLANPTIVVLTDRNDLDDQLFNTFSECRDLIRQSPVQARNREHLKDELNNRPSGGVIFTTIQKFTAQDNSAEHPMLTDRRNVVVIADEAHRSQYGFNARIDRTTGEIGYGFAKYLRDALPNASFIGFTGTPVEKDNASTRNVFGDDIDVYDISRAVEDGATVPIFYESRLARLNLPEDEKAKMDAEIESLTEGETAAEKERLKRKWTDIKAVAGAKQRLEMIAKDLVEHHEKRSRAMASAGIAEGKAMIVCMSRKICVALHDEIVALRPEWRSDDQNGGKIKVVMTGGPADPENLQPHIGRKTYKDLLAKRMKDPDDPLKIAIVCDMWLTGFDVPSLHTMYIDAPMWGHNLMQAIARVNRVFKGKSAGLVVDYIGVAQNLKVALKQYSDGDREQISVDESEIVNVMLEHLDIVRAMFHGFDYMSAFAAGASERLEIIDDAADWIAEQQKKHAARETDEEKKKIARRRFQDAALALSRAFVLAAASDEAREARDEIGFFQAVRATLAKIPAGAGAVSVDRMFAVQQIIDRSVASTEIIDILGHAGFKNPDIAILSDEFLAEVREMKRKNLALEALRRILNNEIRARSLSNVVEARRFSERLESAMARYHTNALSTVEVLQELIALARDIRESRARGEDENLSSEEIAFYDALADNKSAVEIMGDDRLKVIAYELLTGLKSNITIDWSHRESARARMRVLVKRILRRHGYPPDLQDSAVQTVLQQAEALSARWSARARQARPAV